MRFIDLFAGLGGFHVALSNLGHECVLASETDADLAELYERNFGIRPAGDIRKIRSRDIPEHDILCAGLPCQPFSKAGTQRGLECPQWGDLIGHVIRILKCREPEFFIIENVPNLVRHDGGKTWASILKRLRRAGYSDVRDHMLSPHIFGIPQIRQRAFIVGRHCKYGGLDGFSWPTPSQRAELRIHNVLDKFPSDSRRLPDTFVEYLSAWQAFLEQFPGDEEFPSFPIWAMEFGASYPYMGRTPYSRGFRGLGRHLGAFGESLRGLAPGEAQAALPRYAREKSEVFPDWKIDFIKKNREFYRRHQRIIDPWLPRVRAFAPSFQKLEWNCKGCERDIWNYVIQFRASGIRVKRPTAAPSLVAMTTSQVPVIAWERRYMTPRECSRLQSIDSLAHLPSGKGAAYKALGNAVNVTVVEAILTNLTSRRAGTKELPTKLGSRNSMEALAHAV